MWLNQVYTVTLTLSGLALPPVVMRRCANRAPQAHRPLKRSVNRLRQLKRGNNHAIWSYGRVQTRHDWRNVGPTLCFGCPAAPDADATPARVWGHHPHDDKLSPLAYADAQPGESSLMPLVKSTSKGAFRKNIKAEMQAGKPPKQAVAIAYAVKRKAQGKKRK